MSLSFCLQSCLQKGSSGPYQMILRQCRRILAFLAEALHLMNLGLALIVALVALLALEVAARLVSSGATAMAAVKGILGSKETWVSPILTAPSMVALELASSGMVAVADS